MADDDLHEEIDKLEATIEQLAEIAERCRKIILFAKSAIVIGALLIVVVVLAPIRFDPAVTIGAMAAIIGGIVVFGSNKSTLERTTADMKSAEARRDELISRLELRTVDG